MLENIAIFMDYGNQNNYIELVGGINLMHI